MIMPETAAQKLEQVLDADKGKEGLQLPKNFEETFKKRENRDLLVKSVNSKFENSDAIKQNKDAIIGACKTEINSWGDSLPSDAGKVAVLYLYNALNGKTLYKEDLPTAFDDFKKNKTEGTGTEGKDATKPAELLKDWVTEINEDIDGTKLHIKDTVEGGQLKERIVDASFKLIWDLHIEQQLKDGKTTWEKISLKGKDKAFFDAAKIKLRNDPNYITTFDDTNMSISTVVKNPEEAWILGNRETVYKIEANGTKTKIESKPKAETINSIKNIIKEANTYLNNPEWVQKYIKEAATQNTDKTKDWTATPEITKTTTNWKENKTVTPEKTASAPTLKDQVTSIPAFKDNEDIQRSLQRIEETQKDLGTTKEQLKTTRETITSKEKEITQKQQELSTVEKDITTANTIPDEIAKEGALSKLTTKKEQLTGELHNLEDQIKPLQRTERRLSGQEIFLTKQLENRNENLVKLVEPTKNKYEESKESITKTIDGLKKSINGNYTEDQKKLIDTEWLKTQLKQQENLLTQLDQSLTDINTVVNWLKPITPAPEKNLANNKTEVVKPVVPEVKPVVPEVKEGNEKENISWVFEFNTQEDFTKFVGKEKWVFQKEAKGTLSGYEIHASGKTKEVALLQLQQWKKYLYTETKAISWNVGTKTNELKLQKLAQEKNVNKVGSSTVFEKKLPDGRKSFITMVEITDKPITPAPEKNLANNKTEVTKPVVATTEVKENIEQKVFESTGEGISPDISFAQEQAMIDAQSNLLQANWLREWNINNTSIVDEHTYKLPDGNYKHTIKIKANITA